MSRPALPTLEALRAAACDVSAVMRPSHAAGRRGAVGTSAGPSALTPHESGIDRRRVAVVPPFRLDLTAALLRRFPAALPTADWFGGTYRCIVETGAGPAIAAVTQPGPDAIDIAVDSRRFSLGDVVPLVRRMLGIDVDTRTFAEAAASIAWLKRLANRYAGMKPARYPSLWEAGVNAILFQSVSMLSAGAVLERFVARFGTRAGGTNHDLAVFPTVDALAAHTDDEIRAVGMSTAKVRALRAIAGAIRSHEWDETRLNLMPTPELCALLARTRGIGSWSAAVIALRGLGRLDVFPARDSGVVRTVAELSDGTLDAAADALNVLGERRGMLYHLLLLARLDARGALGPAAAARDAGYGHPAKFER